MFRADQHTKTRGQSIVELALILPVAILILALAGDFGRAMTAYIQVGSAAREGAAYGMQSTERAQDQDGMRAAAQAETSAIWGEPISVSFPGCTDTQMSPSGQPYNCVAVTVSYTFRPFITIWPIPNSIPMERTVEMRVVN
jgi:Flp pilus assembly protein TadG